MTFCAHGFIHGSPPGSYKTPDTKPASGGATVTRPVASDPDDIPDDWIHWRQVGHLGIDQTGGLVFPAVAGIPGIYRFLIYDGDQVVAGYIGQAAKSLAGRFNLYRSRGRKPSTPLDKKTTSRNAVRLIAEIQAGHAVAVALIDDRVIFPDGREMILDLADKVFRSRLERRLILQLAETGIEVLNRNGNPRWLRES